MDIKTPQQIVVRMKETSKKPQTMTMIIHVKLISPKTFVGRGESDDAARPTDSTPEHLTLATNSP